jgi:pimeloyl-ACP methyl ester carboxylesterase
LRAGNRQALRARVMRQEKSRVDLLGQIQQPTLIMWGQNDKWIPFENAAKFDSILPNSTIVSYPNAGHIPMEELPTQSASDALLFLTQNLNN